jgi:flagellar FliJ protein
MRRIERLVPVVQHVDKKQEKALQEVALSQGQVSTEKNRLDQLKVYRNEYLKNKGQLQQACSAIELQEYNRFLVQLDETIKKQLEVIRLRETDLDIKRRAWQTTRIDSKVMHKVVENLEQHELLQQERKEQKSMDEFAQRKAHHR